PAGRLARRRPRRTPGLRPGMGTRSPADRQGARAARRALSPVPLHRRPLLLGGRRPLPRGDGPQPAVADLRLFEPSAASRRCGVQWRKDRCSWTERMTAEPSPTAEATRFTEPDRTSPTANSPG